MKEIWKQVIGYEGYYEVSNMGRVKSVDRMSVTRGKPFLKKGRIKNLCIQTDGYVATSVCKNGIEKTLKVHRMVAQAFIPNPENKPDVNHIYGMKADNRVSHLEWHTETENNVHALKTGLRKPQKGENHYSTKLTNVDVAEIKTLWKSGELNQRQIAKKYKVCFQNINDILRNKTWKHIIA